MPGRTRMRIPVTLATLLLWLLPLFGLQPNAKSLLHDAAARYRNSKSFRLEFETTITSSSPNSHGWSKQMYAVAAADHKYHWEQKGSGMTGLRLSDSQSDWFYRPGARHTACSLRTRRSQVRRLAARREGLRRAGSNRRYTAFYSSTTMPIPPCCSMTNC
jgi:outer membrane lipoprotein-sorting protein